jgi:peptidyl-prolyl cis-trans isomerase B (cyclophilin B)
MALDAPNTGGSPFYLMHRPARELDGKHTVFGRVLTGMDVVEKLAAGDVLQEAVVLRRRDHPYRPIAEK